MPQPGALNVRRASLGKNAAVLTAAPSVVEEAGERTWPVLGRSVIGVVQPKRVQQSLAVGGPDVRSGDRLDHLAEQDGVDVAVADALTGRELQRTILDQLEDLFRCELVLEVAHHQVVHLLAVRRVADLPTQDTGRSCA